ncbi:glycoside hydrolase family 13 protein [Paenibacillus chitinolyticus]|uniref:glycoside hydrolase family 13 protein n=1 Tax=Paenibacillus chitinolyticus TaxID=79263 RepID=UPI0036713BAE
MLLEAIDHRSGQAYCYAYDERTVHIRLRTKKDDVDAVHALHGDKYDWERTALETKLYKTGSDQLFDYWQGELVPPHYRLRYAFKLTSGEEVVWLTEKGFGTEKSQDPLTFFDYPFLWPQEVLKPPAWVKEAVFYQIFPDRFANGDPANDPPGVRPWSDSDPGPYDFYGGDLQGVYDRIDYLTSLGVNAIYFTPLFEAATNHKYDTADYKKVDPGFGDTALLKKLVAAFHERGIRVILDAVFNHSGEGFAPFRDVREKGQESPYRDWFHIKEYPLRTEPRPSYHCFAFESHMPKLNTANPEVRNYLLDVAEYWVRECDIDGWRLDVANEVDHEFWREFRKKLKELKPDFYILGEIWHDAMPWLQGDQFDAVMNYPATDAILDYFAMGEIDARELGSRINRLLASYPQQVNEAAFNILGSHDTPRLLTRIPDEAKAKLAVLLQFTLPGTPCIYYGDEIGMQGGPDPDCRKPMQWDAERQNHGLLAFYRMLIELRRTRRALSEGTFRFVYAEKDQLIVLRKNAEEELYICVNNSSREASCHVFEPESAYSDTDAQFGIPPDLERGSRIRPEAEVILGQGSFVRTENGLSAALPPFGWLVASVPLRRFDTGQGDML